MGEIAGYRRRRRSNTQETLRRTDHISQRHLESSVPVLEQRSAQTRSPKGYVAHPVMGVLLHKLSGSVTDGVESDCELICNPDKSVGAKK